MRDYLEEAVDYLRDAYGPPGPVQFYLSVDDVELDVTQAEPLGLIVNEAITNASSTPSRAGEAAPCGLRCAVCPGALLN
jgi:hypothetical protein